MINLTKLTNVILMVCLLTSQEAFAKNATILEKIMACTPIKEAKKRLHCFDQLSSVVSSTMAVEQHTVEQVELQTANAAAQKNEKAGIALTTKQIDDFSKDSIKKTPDQLAAEINTITMTISKLTKSIRGQWQIFFANGQQWQQKDNVRIRLKEGDKIELVKGALGSIFLKKYNTNKRIKVKRLK